LLRVDTSVFPKPAPFFPEDAERMRFVDQQPSLAPLLELDKADEVGDVAIHAVEALGYDEGVAGVAASFPQQEIEMVEIVVAKNYGFGRGSLGPADDAVMGQFIDEKRVVRPQDMGNRRHIGEIAADQDKRRLGADKFGDARFKMAMRRSFAADEAGAERANPQRVQSRRRRGLNHGMGREPQIIIIGETDKAPTVDSGFPPQSVDRREKRVTAVEVSLSGEPEALRSIFGKAVEFLHVAFGWLSSRSDSVKSGVLAAASACRFLAVLDRSDPTRANRGIA
jgi:hypothetical protein